MTETCPRCSHWHRRAQQAEAELCVTAEERSRQGLSIGRRLAGATWHHYKDRAEAAEARLKELEQERDDLQSDFDSFAEHHRATEESLAALEQRLRAVVEKLRACIHDGGGRPIRDIKGHAVLCTECRWRLEMINVLESILPPPQ